MSQVKDTDDAILLLSKRILSVENSLKMQNEQLIVLISGMNSLLSLQKGDKVASSVVQSPQENDTLPPITNHHQMSTFDIKEYVSVVRRKLHNRINQQNKIVQAYVEAHSKNLGDMNGRLNDIVKSIALLDDNNKKLTEEYLKFAEKYNNLSKKILDITDNISKATNYSFTKYIPKNIVQETIDNSFLELKKILVSEQELSTEIGRIEKVLKGSQDPQHKLFIPSKKDVAAVKLIMDLWFAFEKLKKRKPEMTLALLAVAKEDEQYFPIENVTLEVYENNSLITFRKIPKSGFCTIWINKNNEHEFVIKHNGELICKTSSLDNIDNNICRISTGNYSRVITDKHIGLAKLPLKDLQNVISTYQEED